MLLHVSHFRIYVESIFHANNSDGNSIPREINSTDRNPKKISEKNIPLSNHEQFDCVRCTQRYFLSAWNKREKKESGEKNHQQKWICMPRIFCTSFFSASSFSSVLLLELGNIVSSSLSACLWWFVFSLFAHGLSIHPHWISLCATVSFRCLHRLCSGIMCVLALWILTIVP